MRKKWLNQVLSRNELKALNGAKSKDECGTCTCYESSCCVENGNNGCSGQSGYCNTNC
ncbi:MAG: hypothetical protein QM528_02270 [Phycisphaerales bacterium]|nr:hypothetical protein [Phycisphaerales bacterium]